MNQDEPAPVEDNDDDSASLSEQNQADIDQMEADTGPSAQRTRPEVIAKRLRAKVGGQYYDTAFVWREIGHCEAFVEMFDAVAQATLNGHDMTRIIERFKEPLTQNFKKDFDKKIQELTDEGAEIPQMIKHISIAGEAALRNILKGAHISIMRAFNKLRRDTAYDKSRST